LVTYWVGIDHGYGAGMRAQQCVVLVGGDVHDADRTSLTADRNAQPVGR
jgi:hypothetical protein